MVKLSVCLLGAVLVAAPVWAGFTKLRNPGQPVTATSADDAAHEERRARNYFTDLPVVTHEGKTLRFYSDVLKDRIVAVTFFYTNCQGMCPITNAKLSNVQKLLGDRMAREIYFVSISIDPETDTPEVLRDYREKFKAGKGWIFLTGEKKNIDTVTYRLGQTFPKETHSPYILLGNVKRAHWQKLRPNVPAEAIAARLEQIAGGLSQK